MVHQTSWTMIRAAADGDDGQREEFARRYGPALAAYFRSRWPEHRHKHEVDDAVQEVFLDCFRDGGALSRAEDREQTGFRAFLYGIARIVAQRVERKRAREREQPASNLDRIENEDRTPSQSFDRAWAMSAAREAVQRNEARARSGSEADQLRVEILRLRFGQGLPIRVIAPRLGIEPARCHHEYATARMEFYRALVAVVAERSGISVREAERECTELMALLG